MTAAKAKVMIVNARGRRSMCNSALSNEELLERAMLAAQSGRHADAIYLYSALLQRREVAELLNQRALSFEALKNHERALQDLEQAVALSPNDPDLYVNRGNVYLREKQYQEAILDFSRALSLRPKCAVALNGRGFAYASTGRIQDALSDYWSAIEINDRYVSPLYNLALLCKKLGDKDGAKALLDRAMRLDSSDPDIVSLSRSVK